MSGLSKEFLHELGADMDDQTFQAFSDHFDHSLHQRIIDAIMHDLTPDQVAQVGNLKDTDSDQVWAWLQANVPNLGEIVKQEVDKTLADVVRSSDHI